MRHKASGPFADFLHRLSRAAAIRLEAAAEGLPVRALTTLVVVTGLGIGGYVALSPVMGGPSTGQSEVAVDAAATDAEEPPPTTQAPAPNDSRGAAPGASASGHPQAPPPPTSDLTPPTSTYPDGATGSPRTETPTPSPSPPESQPSPDRPRPKKDDTPPDTSLSEQYPDPDAALFLLSATEDASFICSLDEGLYAPVRFSAALLGPASGVAHLRRARRGLRRQHRSEPGRDPLARHRHALGGRAAELT